MTKNEETEQKTRKKTSKKLPEASRNPKAKTGENSHKWAGPLRSKSCITYD